MFAGRHWKQNKKRPNDNLLDFSRKSWEGNRRISDNFSSDADQLNNMKNLPLYTSRSIKTKTSQ